jgi:redox-sensitive bicupin YhaK (pirin superfamily)
LRALLLDVNLKPDATWLLQTDPQATLFIFIVEGAGLFGNPVQRVESHRAVLFGEGDTFRVQTEAEGMRLVLFAGRPLREPIAWGGPIVMNTQEELNQAFAEIYRGTFIREKGVDAQGFQIAPLAVRWCHYRQAGEGSAYVSSP